MKKISVLLVDDQKLFVDNLKLVLDLKTDDIDVIGVAYNGKEALELVEELQPAVILMDVRMPVMDGVEATKLIHRKYPDIKILVLTTFEDDDYVRDALANGAHGYILKNIPPEKLFSFIRAMQSGGVLFSPEVADKVMHWQKEDTPSLHENHTKAIQVKAAFQSLSPREIEIIDHIAMAYSNKQISEKLFLSEQTVKNYISKIYTKIGVTKRSQLMRAYYELKDEIETT